jgi:pimeloyl-ACP methyl ester carboxylesterase
MPTVQLPGGESIWFRKSGSGAPLLQIHGTAFGHRNFEKLTPLMVPHFEVIEMDLPGYGDSKGKMADSMAGIGDQVFAFINAARLGRINVHGTSFGAMIALAMAARHPEVIDKLVLSCFLTRYDNAARMMRGTWKRAAMGMGMEYVADLTSVAGFARSFYDRPEAEGQLQSMREAFSKNTPEAMVAGTEAIERTDLSEFIPHVAARTLMLAGAEDNMTPFKPATSGVGFFQIQDKMQNAELAVLPDCGHYLVIEQPKLCAEKIVEFVYRQPIV